MSETPPPASPSPLFRQEALEHHARPEVQGSLLRLSPLWARSTYWVLVALLVVGGVGLALVDISDYAQGPLLIQVKGLEDVSTPSPGRVSRVRVVRGQKVQAGEPLVELYSSAERAQRDRVSQEYRTQMAALLVNPLDATARQSVASLRAQLELNDALLSERTLRAPHEGVINDVRVREGQVLNAGEVVASVLRGNAESQALALLPGRYRPMLKPGQSFRLELAGFPYLYQELTATSVSDELVGPAEVRRYLGPVLGDSVAVDGPVVVVQASLPGETFVSDARTYHYYTGMPGTARVKVRARNGWVTLLPILEYLWRRP